MVEQLEMVEPAGVAPFLALEGNPPAPALSRRAREAHEQVAHDLTERMLGRRSNGGTDEVVGGVGQERHLAAAVTQQLVGIALAPLLLDAASDAEVLDTCAASVHQGGEWSRFGKPTKRPAGDVRGLLERRPQVRRTQAEHVSHQLSP